MKVKKLKKDKIIEVGVLLEDFNSKFDLVAEQTAQIPEIKNKVDDLTEDMKTVKEDVFMMKKDMVIVKTDLEFIKHALKKKVDVDEFAVLERRVSMLESGR
ncbi:MAG: hypothetical protein Q8R55_05230 [Candidatus Taylorbacteria bacterium]|nr:hypothetical protein [Candidatus Taylorbacteria bacterium]